MLKVRSEQKLKTMTLRGRQNIIISCKTNGNSHCFVSVYFSSLTQRLLNIPSEIKIAYAKVRADGHCRAVEVGRCKIEPRPTLRVEFAAGDGAESSGAGQLYLQQAETVRLASPGPTARPVTDLRVGDLVERSGTGSFSN